MRLLKRNRAVESKVVADKIKVLLPSFCPKLNSNKSTDLAIASIEYYAKVNRNVNIEVVSFGDYDAGEFTASNVHHNYLGYVGCEDLIDAIDACHISLVLSKFETFGQVVAESMARGTPVIARSNTAISEMITHKRDGYLVEQSDVESVAIAMEWFRTNEQYEKVCTESRTKVGMLMDTTAFEVLYFKILKEFYYEK
ncbi:glycosyltransferase [Vibrio alfacsensis]|uniref:Glycosyltransferase n=1 Tax=Vibrio alfacsensis TaxID=1074311 RepID=A0ABM6YWP2_9VIBR|nr:glycosyltransferase [Vibrio alfacsensis]